jgi:RNA polymerase sigma factor (sigma-70 family)
VKNENKCPISTVGWDNKQMADVSDMDLVREYADRNSEPAFAEMVRRHINLVYSVALRFTSHTQDAQDVTQAVFVILAQKAGGLRATTILTGWLYETTRFTAMKFMRTRASRQLREQEAYMSTVNDSNSESVWRRLAPLLEEAMARLSEKERTLVALRYFENKSAAETATLLGIQEWAARKRVERAMEKLRQFFMKRGVAISGAAIAEAVSANSIQAAPAGLAATISASLFSGTAFTTTAVITATKTLAMTTLQKTIITAALAVIAGAGIFEAQQNSESQKQIQSLQQQQNSLNGQLEQSQRERDNATNLVGGLIAENARLKSNANEHELLKLRGEVTHLRTANAQSDSNDPADQAAKVAATKVKQLKQWLEQNPNNKIPELQYLTAQEWLRSANYTADLKTDDDFDRATSQLRRDAKRKSANAIGEALANYIAGNNGQLPGDISQLEPYANPPIDGAMLQRYQLLQTGNLSDIPANAPLIGEKAPVDDQYDSLFTISATGFSYQGTGTAYVNGNGKGNFGTNITAKIKPFEQR